MTDAKRIDGDDMTYWWQVADSAGAFDADVLSDMTRPQTLYGTMHNGDVAGLSLVDVPATYNTQTHAQRTDNALWHLAKRMAELGEEVRELKRIIDNMTADR